MRYDGKTRYRFGGYPSVTIAGLLILIWAVGCSDDKPTEPPPARSLWETSTPQEQGIDPLLLDSAAIVAAGDGFVDGLLVVRNGYLVWERYFNGYTSASPHNNMSVSKSFLSALAGKAYQEGYIDSLDQRVLEFFPEYVYPGMEPAKYDITIRHLLTMRMGIRDESDDNYAEYNRLHSSDNWVKATIETPLLYSPGERWLYNTFETHLLSAIVTKATGVSTRAYATASLLTPMGITVDVWEQDPQGYYFGGNSMYFTPQEMAKLGWMYLNGGQLNGTQIVPVDWVQLTLTPSTNLTHPNQWGEFKNYNYAYLWWLGEVGGEEIFMAYGYGGQFVIVFPALNMVVVSTARNQVDPDTSTVQEWAIFDIIANYIVPAAHD